MSGAHRSIINGSRSGDPQKVGHWNPSPRVRSTGDIASKLILSEINTFDDHVTAWERWNCQRGDIVIESILSEREYICMLFSCGMWRSMKIVCVHLLMTFVDDSTSALQLFTVVPQQHHYMVVVIDSSVAASKWWPIPYIKVRVDYPPTDDDLMFREDISTPPCHNDIFSRKDHDDTVTTRMSINTHCWSIWYGFALHWRNVCAAASGWHSQTYYESSHPGFNISCKTPAVVTQ